MGYPQYLKKDGTIDTEKEQKEADRIYLVFELFKNNSAEKELQEYVWDMNRVLPSQKMKSLPYAEKLVQLINLSCY